MPSKLKVNKKKEYLIVFGSKYVLGKSEIIDARFVKNNTF